MKILATADLHGNLPPVPECDLLLVAGDVCPLGIDREAGRCLEWLDGPFRCWLLHVDAPVVGIAGNHDFVMERAALAVSQLYLPWTYLLDGGTVVEDVRIWGTPWVPNLRTWAFYGDDEKLSDAYGKVPTDLDVLLSHGPPYGYGDRVAGPLVQTTSRVEISAHVGAQQATLAIQRAQPKTVVCGHIHEGFGYYRTSTGTGVYNVSYVDEFYVPRDDAIVEIMLEEVVA